MANTALRVTELDFDSIKENLKNYLRSQSQFQDFDFEGSGMSVLLDILAYNTHYMGYYLNVVGNEMFLDTAQLRSSVLSHAKLLNYVPQSNHGAKTQLNIIVTPSVNEDQDLSSATVQKYSQFLGETIDGINYPFVALYSNTAPKIGGSYSFANVNIIQGEVITLQYEMDPTNTKRRFKIPSSNVDLSTVTITVQESAGNTSTVEYTLSNDLTEVTANSTVYFIEEDTDLNYTFYFGDNVIGKRPNDGNIIICTYVDTVGSPANKVNNFTLIESVSGFSDNISVTSIAATYGGGDKETIEQVRFRAPYFYTTQNRAVTIEDYATLITKDYPNIDSVSVWGGDDNIPPIYGKVFLSLKTKDNFTLSNLEKENIKNSLIETRNVLTVIPEIVDPEFTYLLVRGSVTYNPTLTRLSASEIEQLVRASIEDYETTDLLRFNSTFRKSKLQSRIETAEKSITGSDIKVFLQKRVQLDPTVVKKYVIESNFPIRKGDYNNQISSFPQINVLDVNGINRQVFFEEIPEAFTGVDSIEVINPGINYTSIPSITIIGDGSGAAAVAKIAAGRIISIDVTNRGINYTRATISITGGGGSEAVAIAKLQAKFGRLRTYYVKINGEKVIVNQNAGSINYETGFIELTPIKTSGTVDNSFYSENVLTFNLPLDKEIITPLRNRIITIDQNDPISIQIEVVSER